VPKALPTTHRDNEQVISFCLIPVGSSHVCSSPAVTNQPHALSSLSLLKRGAWVKEWVCLMQIDTRTSTTAFSTPHISGSAILGARTLHILKIISEYILFPHIVIIASFRYIRNTTYIATLLCPGQGLPHTLPLPLSRWHVVWSIRISQNPVGYPHLLHAPPRDLTPILTHFY